MVQGEIRFWNGSKIFLCHLQHQKDLTKYYGPDFHVLFIEEATQFSEFMIRFLRSRLRIPEALSIPDKYLKPNEQWRDPNVKDYYFPRAIYTSNPGGIGHGYIKRSFLTGFKPYQLHRAPDDDGGHTRQFIPARVDDNPSVNREEVKAGLSGLPPVLVDAMLNGNWNAVIGAYFPEIGPQHLIKPFDIPTYWTRLMAMDWGACGDGDPFAIGWAAVSDGSIPGFPKEHLLWYRIWYGQGLPKTTVQFVAKGILEREAKDPQIFRRVAGGDILEKDGTGPSVREIFSEYGIHFARADMRRVSGWQQMRERWVGKHDIPMMGVFDTYRDELETVMQLQHDLNDPNDAAAGEDHVADMLRYGAMSRPWSAAKPASEKTLAERFKPPTIDELWQERDRLINRDGR